MINFQSKVTNTDGTNVTDGTYDFVFKIYNGAGSAGTASYTESWTSSALFSQATTAIGVTTSADGTVSFASSATNCSSLKKGQILTNTTKGESTVIIDPTNACTGSITVAQTISTWSTGDTITNKIYVKNGIFKVAIGSLTAISGVDFNSDTLFLGINFNADGEAKPRIQLAAAPYAFNSDQVNGISFSGTSGNSYTLPSTNNGTILTSNASSQTVTSTQTSGTLLAFSDSTAQTAAETGLSITMSGTGSFDQTGLSFSLSGATGTNLNDILGSGSTWKVSKGGAITATSVSGGTMTGTTLALTPGSNVAGLTVTGTNITSANLLNLSANNTSGTLINASYGSSTVTAGALTGQNIDLSANVTSTNQNETGLNIVIDNPTNTNTSGTELLKGIIVSAGGTITQNGSGGSTTFNAIDATVPALTLTTGTALNGNGLSITGGNITQSAGTLTENGISIDQSGVSITTGGTLNGLKILPPTTAPSVGTNNIIFLGTSTSSTANTLDSATISIGNIASTAQQNRTTLNLQNGGTGYFDLELVRGFINFQQTNYFDEEFTEKALDTTNRMTSTATGTTGLSCGIGSAVVNGVYRMTTGTIANNRCDLSTLATLSNGFYQRGNNPVYEANVKTSSATNGGQREAFGFSAAVLGASDTLTTAHAYILKRSADTTWQCSTSDGATESVTSTGVAIDTAAFHRLRVSIQGGTTPQVICSIDGTSISKTTNIPGATTAMDIYAKAETIDTTTENVDVDYIRAWQDDPAPGLAVDSQPEQTDTTLSPTPSVDEIGTPSASPTPSLSNETNFLDIASSLFSKITDFFQNIIFHGDVTFAGRATFDSDTGGTAVIQKGDTTVAITFSKEYAQTPVISANMVDTSSIPNYSFILSNRSSKGFTITLNKPAEDDVTFSWLAVSVKDPKLIKSQSPTATPTETVPTPTIDESQTPISSDSAH